MRLARALVVAGPRGGALDAERGAAHRRDAEHLAAALDPVGALPVRAAASGLDGAAEAPARGAGGQGRGRLGVLVPQGAAGAGRLRAARRVRERVGHQRGEVLLAIPQELKPELVPPARGVVTAAWASHFGKKPRRRVAAEGLGRGAFQEA